jgi:hypothetical protein
MLIYGRIAKSNPKKKPKAVREQYEQWLAGVNQQKTNFAFSNTNTKVQPKAKVPSLKTPPGRETPYYPSLNTGGDKCTKPVHNKVYTGDKIIGIGTLHKSNAVPIFNSEEAIAISKMRR